MPGTRVEAASPAKGGDGFTQALNTIEAVQQFGTETERHVQHVADIVADSELASQLGCRPGRRWLCISSLRTIPGDVTQTPICWTDVYIDGAFADEVRTKMAGHHEIFGTLVEKISGRRFVEIRQDISAVGVSDAMAEPLKATAGAHALSIRRQYLFASNELAEVSLSIHPADRYRYSTRAAAPAGRKWMSAPVKPGDDRLRAVRLPDHLRPGIRRRHIDHAHLHALGTLPAIDGQRARHMDRLTAQLLQRVAKFLPH